MHFLALINYMNTSLRQVLVQFCSVNLKIALQSWKGSYGMCGDYKSIYIEMWIFCFSSVFWSVHPHSSHHDWSQEEDGCDASATQSQWNQVRSHQHNLKRLIMVSLNIVDILEFRAKPMQLLHVGTQIDLNEIWNFTISLFTTRWRLSKRIAIFII